MNTIKDKSMGGERPLFASHDLRLDNVTITAGESGIKMCSNIEAVNCRFEGKYPFWHVNGFRIDRGLFTPGARAALWYSRDLVMTDTLVEAPKMFREMDNVSLERVSIPDAKETFWNCRGIRLRDVDVAAADYIFMHCSDIDIDRYRQQGNYSFQYVRNAVIRNAILDSRDCLWETDNVTLIDCSISGEFIGWHSRGLKLIRCHIAGTQPLCYARDLVMEDCTMAPDCDLAFEDSTLQATILSPVHSVKNPRSGSIVAESYGEIILDENIKAPGDCKILTR